MKFETKFNLLDHAWYMKNNKATEVVISAIKVFLVGTDLDQITYNASDAVDCISWVDHQGIREECLFKSKIALLDSL